MFSTGTSSELDDRALIVRCLADVSRSLTVNLIAMSVFSTVTICGAIVEMVGRVFWRAGAARPPRFASSAVANITGHRRLLDHGFRGFRG